MSVDSHTTVRVWSLATLHDGLDHVRGDATALEQEERLLEQEIEDWFFIWSFHSYVAVYITIYCMVPFKKLDRGRISSWS